MTDTMKIAARILLILLAVIYLVPILWPVMNSFMPPEEAAATYARGNRQIRLWPQALSLAQYRAVLSPGSGFLRMLLNSLALALAICAGQAVVSVLCGYVFAKVRFKGRDALFFVYIVVMMMPFQVTLLPTYIVSKQLGLYDTWWALILPGWISPFGVFLIRQFMLGIPDDMMEAAELDTSAPHHVLLHIVIPALTPALVTLMILTFAESWNMVEQPLILLRNSSSYPLSLLLNDIVQKSLSYTFSGAVLYMLPLLILYLLFGRQLTREVGKIGFTQG